MVSIRKMRGLVDGVAEETVVESVDAVAIVLPELAAEDFLLGGKEIF
jgi:hypothetical protein